jgi:hypothetical protein
MFCFSTSKRLAGLKNLRQPYMQRTKEALCRAIKKEKKEEGLCNEQDMLV